MLEFFLWCRAFMFRLVAQLRKQPEKSIMRPLIRFSYFLAFTEYLTMLPQGFEGLRRESCVYVS